MDQTGACAEQTITYGHQAHWGDFNAHIGTGTPAGTSSGTWAPARANRNRQKLVSLAEMSCVISANTFYQYNKEQP
eukprot:11197849-Heterocapsa_arctica.AAC.1